MKIPSPTEVKDRPFTAYEVREAQAAQRQILDSIAYARNIIKFEDNRTYMAWRSNFLDDWQQAGWYSFYNMTRDFVLISPDKFTGRYIENEIFIEENK